MKPILLAIVLHAVLFVSAQQTFTTVYFDNDVYALHAADKKVLHALADSLQQKEIKSILLFGYADSSADIEYNRTLSQNRIQAVYTELSKSLPDDYFKNKNIEPILKWYGEDVPDQVRKKLHYGERCVDIIVNYKQPEVVKVNSIQDLYSALRPEPQKFCLDNTRDTVLQAKDGTLIYVKANSFDLSSVNMANACIQLRLIEGYSNSDMLLNHLTTVDHGKQLETGGMVHVQAEVNGVIVPLLAGSDLVYMLPAKNVKDDMQVFTGESDADGSMGWSSTGNGIDYFNGMDFLQRNYSYTKHYHCNFFWCGFSNLFRSGDNKNDGWWHNRYAGSEYMYPEKIKELMQKYGVKDPNSLRYVMAREAKKRFEGNLQSASVAEWNYYIFSSTALGWMNCDRFSQEPEKVLTNVKINLQRNEGTDAKLIFRSMKSVLAPDYDENNYTFSRVKIGEPVWIFAIRYQNDKVYMCLQKTTIEKNMTFEPEFKEYTLPQLKIAMQWMNA